VGKATGAWPRLDGAPKGNVTPLQGKSYEFARKKAAKYLGLDALFTCRSFCQSIQEKEGKPILVNSSKRGDVLVEKPVPNHLAEKPWFKRKLRFPREYVGIPHIQERFEKLSFLVHIIVQGGIPSRKVWKGLHRLSKTWFYVKFADMRKHIHSLTQEVIRSQGKTRSPWMPKRRAYPKFPVFTGVKVHESGYSLPLWELREPSLAR